MGEAEQDALVGQAVREGQEAAKELACIRLKAGNAADYLKQMSERLRQIADNKSVLDPKFNDYPAPEQLDAIFKAYHKTHSRVSRANENLNRLGVKNITFVD